MPERLLRHNVLKCPRCGKTHGFALRVGTPTLVFGGPGDAGTAPEPTIKIGLTCPITHQVFTDEISLRSGEEYLGLGVHPAPGQRSPSPAATEDVTATSNSEYDDWIAESRSTATDFCKTMITTCSAAIPVYFAALKYLGYEKTDQDLTSRFAIVPPATLVVALVIFAAGLRPRLAALTVESFESFRNKRLRRLNMSVTIGTALFSFAIAAALLVFAALLRIP